jgi:cytochrome P450
MHIFKYGTLPLLRLTNTLDTCSNCALCSTYLLAANPDKEAKLLAEIDALGPDFVPTFDNMQTGTALPYLHAVLQEALRMYPPAPFTIRQAKEDMTVGGYFIPKGTFLKVALYCMHRSAHYWKDPVQFLPERFMENEPEFVGASPDAFAPFGGGARRCPGYNLAQIEAKMALLRLYQRYTFRTLPGDKGLKTKTLVTLTPVGGVRMTVHKRQD